MEQPFDKYKNKNVEYDYVIQADVNLNEFNKEQSKQLYNLITDEFRYLSKTIGVVIYVLNMPFINTFNEVIDNDTLRNFVIDLVLQILSFIS